MISVTQFRAISLACILSVTFTSVGSAQDKCSDILGDGVKAVFKLDTNRSEAENTRDWFCSDEFTSHIQKKQAGAKVTVPIEGVPVEFSGQKTSGSEWQKRQKYCGARSRQFSLDQTYTLLRSVGDATIVDGWLRCMVPANDASPLDKPVFVSLSGKGNAATITSRWIKQDARQRNPVVKNVTLAGLTCKKPALRPSVRLRESATSQTCAWDTNQDAVAVIDTSLGSAAARLPRPLDGRPAGKATVRIVPLVQQWVGIGQQSIPQLTGNHSQSGYGDRGPTRYAYTVRLQVAQNQKLSGVTVHQGGEGCPWTGYRGPLRMEDQDRRAVLDFEAWGSPCTYTLVGSVSELRDVPGPIQESTIDVIYGRQFSVRVPGKRQSAEISFVMQDGSKLALKADGGGNDAIALVSRDPSGDGEILTYLVNIPRSK